MCCPPAFSWSIPGSPFHLSVPARRFPASGRQHALPLGLRRQHRGRHGALAVSLFLSTLWRPWRGPGSRDLRADLPGPGDRRQRRRLGRVGGLSDPAPQSQGAGADPLHPDLPTGLDPADLLDRLPGLRPLGPGRRRGNRLVGPYRRLPGGHDPHSAVPLPDAPAVRRCRPARRGSPCATRAAGRETARAPWG